MLTTEDITRLDAVADDCRQLPSKPDPVTRNRTPADAPALPPAETEPPVASQGSWSRIALTDRGITDRHR